MPEVFQGLGVFEWTILIAGVLLFCYSIHLAVDQRTSLRFMASRQPATFVIAAVLAVLGIGSYVGRGMQPRDLVTACVLVAVGVSLAAVRAGMGSRGIYAEGLSHPVVAHRAHAGGGCCRRRAGCTSHRAATSA